MTSATDEQCASRDWVAVSAPAKINLRLDVLGRRADGYHELATAMLAIGLADQLFARRSVTGETSLRLSGPAASADIPTDERNLVWRAAVATLERSKQPAAVELVLEKHVPSRAGLGGGSSDAASAVRAVDALLELGLSPAERAGILAGLGSDTVFFDAATDTGLAWCLGRGERVFPIDVPVAPLAIVVLVPAQGASTSEVYARLDAPPIRSSGPDGCPPAPPTADLEALRSGLYNGLEAAACCAQPVLGRWRELLDREGLEHYCLSGSGSAWFGLHAGRAEAGRALDRVLGVAREEGLELRLATVTEPAGHGVGAPVRVSGPREVQG